MTELHYDEHNSDNEPVKRGRFAERKTDKQGRADLLGSFRLARHALYCLPCGHTHADSRADARNRRNARAERRHTFYAQKRQYGQNGVDKCLHDLIITSSK